MFPRSALQDIIDSSLGDREHFGENRLRRVRGQTAYFASFLSGEFVAWGGPLLLHILHIFKVRSPSKMVRVDAPFVASTAGVSSFMFRARRFTMGHQTHEPSDGHYTAIYAHDRVTARVSHERRGQTLSSLGSCVLAYPHFNSPLSNGNVQWIAVALQTMIVCGAKSIAERLLVAAVNGTYKFGLSHLNLRNRFGSARTRRSATTPGGFAISKAIGGVLQA